MRENVDDGELAYFTTWRPAGIGIETLLRVADHRWSIEGALERCTEGSSQ